MPNPKAKSQKLELEHRFPKTLRVDWEKAVETVLKGRDFKTLERSTESGIVKGPLKTKADYTQSMHSLSRNACPLRGARPWHICVPVTGPSLTLANSQILEDLEGGASALRLDLSAGLTVKKTSDLKRLLSGVYTDLIPISFASNPQADAILDMFQTVPEYAKGRINFGLTDHPDPEAFKTKTRRIESGWRFFTIDGAGVHNAGGTKVLELAFMAAKTVELMRAFGPDFIAKRSIVELAADQDGHELIAKIRAARRLYARIASSFGLSDVSIEIHTITSNRMMQSTDPWTNFLRMSSACFGSVCGGADTITLQPFTQALGLPTPFGHRTARNIQLLLMEESHLGTVDDPAFGSDFHEYLSNELALKAWSIFQDIEAAGGLSAYTQTGALQARIDVANTARAERADPIVGVTLHPAKPMRAAKVRKA